MDFVGCFTLCWLIEKAMPLDWIEMLTHWNPPFCRVAGLQEQGVTDRCKRQAKETIITTDAMLTGKGKAPWVRSYG